jgi:M6 family metalloprotease-like protein
MSRYPIRSVTGLAAILVLAFLAAPAPAWAERPVTLTGAGFAGLTEIVASTNADLTGITGDDVVVTKPDGTVVPAEKITHVAAGPGTLTVDLAADQSARITSTGTTIATRAFGSRGPSRPVPVLRAGEPASNGHLIGSSQWTDNGWSTSFTDPTFYDPVTGQAGLWRFEDIHPDQDADGNPIAWNDGGVRTPAHKSMRMLVLFVQFPDRLAANSQAPYQTMQPYQDFIAPAAQWFNTASYGQFQLSFVAPQITDGLDWIMMNQNANRYTWDAQTHNMFGYAREAFQHAYDNWGLKADDYDMALIMPARGRSGLPNGPGNINRDPTDGEQTNTNQVAYVDHDGKPHYVSTVLTAGNDLFSWGYRWLNHEAGHTIGFPDLYMYSPTRVKGVNVNQFFWVGGWDIMGNIGGHSNDYVGFQKWKVGWLRDDQADVVSRAGSTVHRISPIETAGGSKIVVIRTGVSTAYVVEFRTKLGVNGLDGRGRYQGMLLYRLDASKWEQRDVNYDLQVISKQYYNDPAVGGSQNLTGVWRPITSSLSGLDNEGALWLPGDAFEDPATGVRIDFGDISHYLAADPANSPYTADDAATLTVQKTGDSALDYPVVLSNAQAETPTKITFETSTELQRRILDSNSINNGHNTYVREESRLTPDDLVVKKGTEVIPASDISGIEIGPTSVTLNFRPGTFTDLADTAGLTISTKAYYYFAASGPVAVPYQFTGFAPPLANPPEWNVATAGATIPVKFSLAGDHGLDVLATGFPQAQPVTCETGTPTETPGTVTGTLHYDATDDQYIFLWRTDRNPATSCVRLDLRLIDGTTHSTYVTFN